MQPVTAIDTVFYYLIDLHYSQTMISKFCNLSRFYYLIDLHYSQTINPSPVRPRLVLLPYRFTLFSNNDKQGYARRNSFTTL